MKTRFILAALVILPTFLISQQIVMNSTLGKAEDMASRGDLRMHEAYKHLVNRLDKNPYMDQKDIEGSTYFIDAFLLSKVHVNKKSTNILFSARYNAYLDLIELDRDNAIEALIKQNNISCSINGELYVYRNYMPKKAKEEKTGYLKVLLDQNNVTLYVNEEVKYKAAKPAKTSLTQSFPARFIKNESYYLSLTTDNDAAQQLTKKSLSSIFGDSYQKKLKSFISKEKINFENKSDLKRLVNYYVSIAE